MRELRPNPVPKFAPAAWACIVCMATLAAGTGTAAETGDADDQEQAALQRVVNPLVFYRQREQEQLLQEAVRLIEGGKTIDGLTYLQRLLDVSEDRFLWAEGTPRLVGLRGEAGRILSGLDRAGLETYEQIYGRAAARLLEQADRTGRSADYDAVIRRFFHTAAGFAAADRQASRLFDHGRPALAARLWSRLIAEPVHRRRVTPTLLLKAAVASRLSGESSRATALVARIRDERVEIAGRPVRAGNWFSQFARTVERPGKGDWPMLLGNAERSGSAEGTPPHAEPLWTTPLFQELRAESETASKVAGLLDRAFDAWESQQQKAARPRATSRFAIVVEDRLVVRDFEGIRAVDPRSGKQFWNYRTRNSLVRTVKEFDEASGKRETAAGRLTSYVDLDQRYANNSVLGTLSSDGERVYFVDDVEIKRTRPRVDRRRRVFGRRPPGEAAETAESRTNRLIAVPLAGRADSVGKGSGRSNFNFAGERLRASEDRQAKLKFERPDPRPHGLAGSEAGSGPPEPIWVVGGPAGRDGDETEDEADDGHEANAAADDPLAGHFFLGPPLVAAGRLFVVAETEQQLKLLALRPETGELVWSQGIGFVERPIDEDRGRAPLACSPAFADGIVVGPTQTGLLVGVDAVSGSLLWACFCGEHDEEKLTAEPTRYGQRFGSVWFGHPAFAVVPQIHGDRIVYLPLDSSRVHCIELSTGRPLWSVRRQDGQYIGGVAGETVLIVGQPMCRGLSLASGKETWSTRLGTPSGRGLPIGGGRYLVPLEEGRIATLEISTGREIGVGFASTDGREAAEDASLLDSDHDGASWRPGNLVAADQAIVSVGTRSIAAFPQTRPLLARVLKDLRNRPDLVEERLLAAALELRLGDLSAGRSRLDALLAGPLSDAQRNRAEAMLRELLYRELDAGNGDEVATFDRLDALSKTPRQRARYVMRRALFESERGAFEPLLKSADALISRKLPDLVAMPANDSHVLSPAAWIAGTIARTCDRADDAGLSRIHARVDSLRQAALDADGTAGLDEFLLLFTRWPQADRVRLELAARLAERGSFQRAEFLLLKNRSSQDERTAAAATRQLFELWDRLGFHEEAARLLDELNGPLADVPLDERTTGRQFVARHLRRRADGLTVAAFRRQAAPVGTVRRARITEQRWFGTDPRLSAAYGEDWRPVVTPHGTVYDLRDRRAGDGTSRMASIDRRTGVLAGEIELPVRQLFAPHSASAHAGHFLPVCGPSVIGGVSLLEVPAGRPLWMTVPEGFRARQEFIHVGPSGPSFSTFQAPGHLIVLDPATGRILWQRTDHDPHAGLLTDGKLGLFGDDEVLVLLHSDRVSYTLYRTATGEELARGRIGGIELDQHRHAFGRKLFHIEHSRDSQRIRIWDPVGDRTLLEEPVTGDILTRVTPEGKVIVVASSGRLIVVDPDRPRIELDVRLEAEGLARLRKVEAFCDRDRLFVNLQRIATDRFRRASGSDGPDTYLSNSPVPSSPVHGETYAFDLESGRLLWRRMLPRRSVLRLPHADLPFLVTAAETRDRRGREPQSLTIELIDAATGETIATKYNLFPSRILQCAHILGEERVVLRGRESRIEIDFGPAVQRLAPDQDPL